MWLYVLVHLFLIVFGFIAGGVGWLSICEYSRNFEKAFWWIGGAVGSGIGWWVAHQLMEVAKSAHLSDSDLTYIVNHWPDLPEAARERVLVVVRAAVGKKA